MFVLNSAIKYQYLFCPFIEVENKRKRIKQKRLKKKNNKDNKILICNEYYNRIKYEIKYKKSEILKLHL